MKRLSRGIRRDSRKRHCMRRLTFESLEAREVLDASFGFVDVPGGFAFEIMGTDYRTADSTPLAVADNIVLWTDPTSFATNFFVEWNDDVGIWGSISGTVTAGDIANEATARNRSPGDFKGFFVKGLDGNDFITANGEVPRTFDLNSDCNLTGTKLYRFDDDLGHDIGILPGAPSTIKNTDVEYPFLGQRLTVDGNAGKDTITGSPEDDELLGGADQDIIIGEAGNDNIQGGAGCDRLWGDGDTAQEFDDRGVVRTGNPGDQGDDAIKGDADIDRIKGGPGGDTIEGGAGNDVIDGGPGDDDLAGDSGNDDISGDAGADRMNGGDGADSLRGDSEDKEDQEGGSGQDGWQRGDDTNTATGIRIVSSTIEKVDTTGSNHGMSPDYQLSGYFRTDTDGPWSNAAQYPFDAPDEIDLRGWQSNVSDIVGVEIITGDGNDILIGSDAGKDRLKGGNDDDILIGLGGADRLEGGSGRDLVTYNAFQFDDGTIPGSPAGVEVYLTGRTGTGGDAQGDKLTSIEHVIGSEFDDRLFGAAQGETLEGRSGNDELIGQQGDDELLGGDGDDFLQGGPDSDSLWGGKGNDELAGNGGVDTLLGGPGDDEIIGGAGADSLSGGKGTDTLQLPTSNGSLEDVFIFGNEGVDIFLILNITDALEQFLLMSNLVAMHEADGESDFDSNLDRLEFTVIENRAPEIISTPVTTATVGQLYVYEVVAIDPDGDVLTYSLDEAPAGMFIDSLSGAIGWVPTSSDVGNHTVTVRVEDPAELFDTQTYTLTVSN